MGVRADHADIVRRSCLMPCRCFEISSWHSSILKVRFCLSFITFTRDTRDPGGTDPGGATMRASSARARNIGNEFRRGGTSCFLTPRVLNPSLISQLEIDPGAFDHTSLFRAVQIQGTRRAALSGATTSLVRKLAMRCVATAGRLAAGAVALSL